MTLLTAYSIIHFLSLRLDEIFGMCFFYFFISRAWSEKITESTGSRLQHRLQTHSPS